MGSWSYALYAILALVLIAPLALHLFRAPGALRNAAILLALFVLLIWGYQQFGHLLPDNVQQNMNRGRSVQSHDTAVPDSPPPASQPQPANDSPVRNL